MTNKPTELEEFTAEQFKEMMYNTGLPDNSPLIKISARTLYKDANLYKDAKIETDFLEWCTEMFDQGFTEGIDYKPVLITSSQGQSSKDFILTLACARKILELAWLHTDEYGIRNMWLVK